MIRDYIESEIAYEANVLRKLSKKLENADDYVLTHSKSGFYYRPWGTGKRTYICRDDRDKLRNLARARYLKTKADILSNNIKNLQSILPGLKAYDDQSVIDALPGAYTAALEVLRGPESDGVDASDGHGAVIQSENPKHRDKLVIGVSNGLKVRSKAEMAIAEALLDYGVNFRYEKTLCLIETYTTPDGRIQTREVKVYPDFTIILPDGSEIYWEHVGKFDDPAIRRTNHDKFNLYYENGIYLPKNLIITMDSEDKPFDIMTMRRIIEGQILPLMKW